MLDEEEEEEGGGAEKRAKVINAWSTHWLTTATSLKRRPAASPNRRHLYLRFRFLGIPLRGFPRGILRTGEKETGTENLEKEK